MKITAVCDDGLSTSLMMETSIKSILKDLSISADVDYVDLNSTKGASSDTYVGTRGITEQLATQSVADRIVAPENMTGKKAMEERLSVALNELGALQVGGGMDFFRFLMSDVFSEPTVLVGLIALIGLIAQKGSVAKCIKGTVKTIMGFVILDAGVGLAASSLGDSANIFQHVFDIQGVVSNNEAIVSIAQKSFGKGTVMIMLSAMVINIMIVRLAPWKFIFLTGHHALLMSTVVAIILTTAGMIGITLIAVGPLVVGVAMVFLPAIVRPYMEKVTGSDDVTIDHFSTLSYVLVGFTGSRFGNREYLTEDTNVPKSLLFLYDTLVAISFTMSMISLVTRLFAGADTVKELSGGKNWLMFSTIQSVTSTADVYITLQGVRMVIVEIIPAFKDISNKLVPSARPTLDRLVVFPYAPNAVLVGFLSNFAAGLIGISTLYLLGMIVIISGVVSHSLVGAVAGVFDSVTGGHRGAILSAFTQDPLTTFLPVFLLPVLGNIGFANTTFNDTDSGTPGILLRIIVH